MDVNVIINVCLLELVVTLIPGLDFFTVLRNSITCSNRAGFATALGVSLGNLINLALTLLCLNSLTAKFPLLIHLVKFAGATYLLYMAYETYKAVPTSVDYNQNIIKDDYKEFFNFFKRGIICNLSNPKAYIFNLSFSQYLLSSPHPLTNSLVLFLFSATISLLWFGTVNMMFSIKIIRKKFFDKIRSINLCFAVILTFIALDIIFINKN